MAGYLTRTELELVEYFKSHLLSKAGKHENSLIKLPIKHIADILDKDPSNISKAMRSLEAKQVIESGIRFSKGFKI